MSCIVPDTHDESQVSSFMFLVVGELETWNMKLETLFPNELLLEDRVGQSLTNERIGNLVPRY